MLNFLFTVLAFLVALGILVSVHEFGHFWVARRMGVKVLRFSIGFGKPFWRYQANPQSTEYALAAIPLGGYVKMLDEREGDVLPEERHMAFNTQHVAKRIAIVAAGPIFNFLLAIFLYSIVAMVGLTGLKPVIGEISDASLADKAGLRYEDKILRINSNEVQTWNQARLALMEAALNHNIISLDIERDGANKLIQLDLQGQKLLKDNQDIIGKLGMQYYRPVVLPIIDEVLADMPAESAGLQSGDLILAVNDEAMSSWREWATYVSARPGQVLELKIKRDNDIIYKQITPIAKTEKEGKNQIEKGLVGVTVKLPIDKIEALQQKVQYAFFPAIYYSIVKTWDMSVLTLKMLAKLIVGEVSPKNISGPITIAEYAGKTAGMDIRYYIDFIAIISISLGLLNLLPIPLLDGGHLLYYFIEVITGKEVSERFQLFAQQIGIVILAMLMLLAFYNDINRLIQ